MPKVSVIKDKNIIKLICIELKKKSMDEFIVFWIAINTGISVTDIIKLKRNDIIGGDNKIYSYIDIKGIKYIIPKQVQEYIQEYIKNKEIGEEDVIFQNKSGTKKINRSQFYRDLNDIIRQQGLTMSFGNKSCEKIFAYYFYIQTMNIKYLKSLHRNKSVQQIYEFIDLEIKDAIDFNIQGDEEWNIKY